MSNQVILVDKNDHEIGVAEKLAAHEQNLLHRAFSVFIFRDSSERQLLLQQRALSKYHCAGLWTNTCCSHPQPGETVVAAGERRLLEELGFKAPPLIEMGWFHYNAHFDNGLAENENDHVLVGTVLPDVQIVPNPEEIHAYRWVRLDEVRQELASEPEKFTPWFKEALELATNK